MTARKPRRVGLIVNPIAGMGGAVGLHGTDNDLALRAAALGARPLASSCAATALQELQDLDIEVLTCADGMGADAASASGLSPVIVVNAADPDRTTSADTQKAARSIAEMGPELLLVVGGDGTARDVLDSIGSSLPLLGVPAGVKMHSGIFAASPRAAGRVARSYLAKAQSDTSLRDTEIIDRGHDSNGAPAAPQLFGIVKTPFVTTMMPGAKSSSRVTNEGALEGAIARAGELLHDARITLVGPGSTMLRLKERAHVAGTALGVDAISKGCLLAADLTEDAALKLVANRPARILTSIVGGQGFLFGRGNQQVSPEVIRSVGTDNIVIVSSLEKLLSIPSGCLLVNTGDRLVDQRLEGYLPVIVSGRRQVLMPVRNATI